MKKTVLILAMILLIPGSAALALHEGAGGGFSGGGNEGDRGNGGNGNAGSNRGTDTTTATASDTKSTVQGSTSTVRESAGTVRVQTWGKSSFGNTQRSSGNSWNRPAATGTSRFSGSANGTLHHFNHSSSPVASLNRNGYHRFNSPSGSKGISRNRFATAGSSAGGRLLPRSLQHPAAVLPTKGPQGKAFSASLVPRGRMSSSVVRNRMTNIAQCESFLGKVKVYGNLETRKNHYYWHTWGGTTYVHYWDGWGCNWYGWYCGNSFFWTQFYLDNWWWYDPYWGRWCYWGDGGWCWQNPATTVVYVYQNGNYSPAGGTNNSNYNSNESEASNSVGEEQPDGAVTFQSPEGSLMVKVLSGGDAFLYNQDQPDSKPVFLDSHVSDVKFSNPGRGTLRVLLILDDGSFETFGANGIPEGQAKI